MDSGDGEINSTYPNVDSNGNKVYDKLPSSYDPERQVTVFLEWKKALKAPMKKD